MKSWSSPIKWGWQRVGIKFGAINKFWIGKIMGGSWAGDEESRGPKVINPPIADAEAMTRIKECAEPPPPRLHLLPPWLPLLPPPSSIWQIHSPTPTSPPSLHLTFLPLFFSTFHTPSTLLRWQTYLLPLLSLQQVSHIHRRHRLLQVLQYEEQAQAGLCDTQRDWGRLRPNWKQSQWWPERAAKAKAGSDRRCSPSSPTLNPDSSLLATSYLLNFPHTFLSD